MTTTYRSAFTPHILSSLQLYVVPPKNCTAKIAKMYQRITNTTIMLIMPFNALIIDRIAVCDAHTSKYRLVQWSSK